MNFRRQFVFALVAVAFASITGCGGGEPPAPGTASPTGDAAHAGAPAKLRLLVVGDPALAQRITRLRGEWLARAGAPLDVAEMPLSDLGKAKTLSADVVIYPSDELGSLAERRLIQPLPPDWLDRPDYQKTDLFELPGLRETAWGEQIYAVPLGSPVFVCLYRPDLGVEPPHTWSDYQRIVESAGASAAIEPLAPGWASKVFLARAAAYAKHRDYYSTLFDKDSLRPKIASEPFVRALSELVAAARHEPQSQMNLTPTDVRREFFAGHAKMVLTWPTAADNFTSAAVVHAGGQQGAMQIAVCELPGSPEVFNPREQKWQPREPDDEPNVPLLGIAGRLGSIVHSTKSADAAFELLVWLSSDEWSSQISPASPATTIFRRTQMPHVARWVEPAMPAAADKQYADAAAAAFSRTGWLSCPRIPGHEEYMAALDDAVRQAVEGKAAPAAALARVAAEWQKITDRIGRSNQQKAYTLSLGLEP